MADKIQASISQSDIYTLILPILENIENETLPELATIIAEAVYELISTILSEDNVYDKIFPLWEEFTQADSITVVETADTLAAVVVDHFFDADTLTERFIPFITRIDETNRLGDLADEIIDSVLIPKVDEINDRFPGLDLIPDWEEINDYLTNVLRALKLALGASTVEELSRALAESTRFIMDVALKEGFETALFRLQDVPPEQAAAIITGWIIELVDIAEKVVVDFIEGKLNDIFNRFDAEKIAEELSYLIYNKLTEVLSEENLYQLILPLLEAINDLDMEHIAKLITKWLLESDIVGDIDEEQIVSLLTSILAQLIGNVNPDNVTKQLVSLILESDIVQGIDGTILSRLLEFKIYQLLLTIGRDINAIELIEVSIQRK
jgi:hypothetical protein